MLQMLIYPVGIETPRVWSCLEKLVWMNRKRLVLLKAERRWLDALIPGQCVRAGVSWGAKWWPLVWYKGTMPASCDVTLQRGAKWSKERREVGVQGRGETPAEEGNLSNFNQVFRCQWLLVLADEKPGFLSAWKRPMKTLSTWNGSISKNGRVYRWFSSSD